ncbi:MAG: tetratricopeptide repeat protein, partial [Spirochaetes bacterium]|nr:tetratricopeptide repeat protein [Spirochaetota bacterium]
GPAPLAGSQPASPASPPPGFSAENGFSAPPPPAARASEGASLSDVAKDYYNAVSLFSQEKYQEAFKSLKAIADSSDDSEYTDKAQFDMGRCLFALGQWDLAIKHFTGIVQSSPKHADMSDILYIMGQSWEKKGDKAKAKAFFSKVLSMPGDEDSSARIKAKKALNALGGA